MAETEQSAAPPARPTFFARNATALMWEIRVHPESIDADIERRGEARCYQLDVLIQAQDHRMGEAQRPEELPIDLAAELHIKEPHAVAVAYRLLLAELGA